ncbi:MAG TPA: serine/threonine-protein kinase [Vicinamibacterales bacterium]
MSTAQWTRLKALFHGALEQSPDAREQWLRDAAGGDLELLHEAQGLIEAHETVGTFLEDPATIDPEDLVGPAEAGPYDKIGGDAPDVGAGFSRPELAPGATIGPYLIIEELGRGGMGVVYLAEDQRLGRRVALKSLPPAAASDPVFRERLRREARAAATISHPAVAVVYSLDEIDGHLLIASEYVRGHTLRAELDRGPIEHRRAVAIAADIVKALAAAHAAGVIHRDLKPENVLVTDQGTVKVVDFGIAYIEGAAGTRLTRDGALIGTPAYMAPEQLVGHTVDARADIYAVGVLLAEMLTGGHPLHPSATPVPTSLAPIVELCVQQNPMGRFASAGDLLHALERATDAAAPGGSLETGSRHERSAARWWWEFHQAVAALAYWLILIPAWNARGLIGGMWGRAVFIAALTAVIVAANLRLHQWFTSRFYPGELEWLRTRVARWILGADWVLALALVAGGLLLGDERSPLAILLIAFGIGAAVAFLVIEPATARAAFRSPSKP